MGNSPPLNPVTPQRSYPLPVGSNNLSDDVIRLATALSLIDADVTAAETKLLGIRSITTSYAVVPADLTLLIDYNGVSSADVITLPLLNAVSRGFNVQIRNSTVLSITLAASNSATINGQLSFTLLPASTIAVVTDGTTWKVLSIAQVSAGSLTPNGSVAQPSHSFTSDPTVGMFLPSSGQGGLVAGGATTVIWSTSGVLVGGAAGGFKGAGTLNAAKLLYNGEDLIARSGGSAAAPTYSFGAEASLGAYRVQAGVYGLSAGGALQFSVSATGLLGAGAAVVSGAQLPGSANLTDLYLNGVSLGSSLLFGPNGMAVAGSSGGVKGAGTFNAQDIYLNGTSLGSLLGLNGVPGGPLNLSDLRLAGNSLAGAMSFSPAGVSLTGAVGGQQGAGTLNVKALYINGVVLNPGLITPTAANALGYLRINAGGNAIEYRTPTQLLGDLGVQTALGYIPVNRNGDTMVSLTIQGTLAVGAAVTFSSSLGVTGNASLTALSVVNAATVGGSLGVAGVTTLAAVSATSLTVNGTVGISGAATLTALTATTGRFSGNVLVQGASTLASLVATTATFSGAAALSSTLSVVGISTFAKTVTSGTSTYGGLATFGAGALIQAGGLTLGFGQSISTTDATNGFLFQSQTLGTAVGATQVLAQFRSTVGPNTQMLRFYQRRLSASTAEWLTAPTRLQMTTDTTNQGFVEWGSNGQVGILTLGAVSAAGADVNMVVLDPTSGITLRTNTSVNGFLGVGGGAQLNGGVSLTGGVSVDTLSGTADWVTTGNFKCRFVTQTSDERLKRDFNSIDQDRALLFVERAEPVGYRWRDPAADDGTHYGYRAQQVEAAGFTEMVRAGPGEGLADARSLDYTSAIPLLHVALRQALRDIRSLRSQVAYLQAMQGSPP